MQNASSLEASSVAFVHKIELPLDTHLRWYKMVVCGHNKRYGNIILYETSMFIVKMADHDGNHRCLLEKNVPIVLILPSRWWDGAESLGIEH